MDSLLNRLNGPTTRLVLISLLSSSLTALTILSLQSLRREHNLSSLKKEASSTTKIHRLNSIGATDLDRRAAFGEKQTTHRAKDVNYDEELVAEQLARNRAFFGVEGISKIRSAFVIVVGAGGVGS